MQTRDETIQDLEIMVGAVRYQHWILSQFAPHLGRRILEIGAGIGTFTAHLLDREQVIAVDNHDSCVERLRLRFAAHPNVICIRMDVSSTDILDLARYAPDTIVCINVLEHIPDDIAALRNMFDVLPKGGRLAMMVPALPFLFGTIDRIVGHQRRYRKQELLEKVSRAGFTMQDLFWMNLLAVPGWFMNNRVLKRTREAPGQILVFDRFVVPWLSILERAVRPPIGLSLVAIGVKM